MDIPRIGQRLRKGAFILSAHTSEQKNHALACVATEILHTKEQILSANKNDMTAARNRGMSEALLERLMLDDKRIDDMITGLQTVAAQADPVGEIVAGWTTPNGMQIKQVRVPLGVVAIIYESRPNVTVDAFGLAYKSGNAILLRGSSSAAASNTVLVDAIKAGLKKAGNDGVPQAVELADCSTHESVNQILTATGIIDVVLPRGGAKLIKLVTENAKVPVIQTGSGVCHLYIDESADITTAVRIAENAKVQRPGACNAIETILVHRSQLQTFLPELEKKLAGRVQMRADERCYPILKNAADTDEQAAGCTTCGKYGKNCVIKAEADDFGFEFLDFICAVKAVDSLEEAITFINTHNTEHSESIVTNNLKHAERFKARIDAACVYVNASTRFTDGGQFGFGAELGISTQKLHARGPMGIQALTTTKYLIDGQGQIR
ncbi:MAG: glutamate-5-semialdehyde dehydrogenase [Treponema sp.]|jgi:glutamate-5-semialdehyde dehydrogenase|nr:glutamate-5-semialdehyde dehydrogenase [Treponema sp.]